jgi:hypothetical protein
MGCAGQLGARLDQSSSAFADELQDRGQIALSADRARDLDHLPEHTNGLLELAAAGL